MNNLHENLPSPSENFFDQEFKLIDQVLSTGLKSNLHSKLFTHEVGITTGNVNFKSVKAFMMLLL